MTETTPTTTPTPPEGLTDERLLELAAKHMEDDYGAINPDEYDPLDEKSLEVCARPAPTPEEIESQFRAWWAESYPNDPAGGYAVLSHVAFARHLLGMGVQR